MIQLQFINHLLDSKDTSLILMNNLDESFFSDYKEEYNYITEHIRKYGNVPDKATFISRFPHFSVIDVKETNKYLLDSLFEDKNKRFLASTFNKVRDLLIEDKVDDALKLYMSASDQAVKATRLESFDIFENVEQRYNAYVDKCNNLFSYYVSTGFKELDNIIGGWDRHEELATIVARTNQGKSWILLKTAIAAAQQGLKVGLYSGEMSEKKVGYRVDTLISNISNTDITHGRIEVQNKYKNFLDKLPTMFKGTIKVLTPAMINGLAGVNSLRAFIEKENLDMLCIDQHSLLEDDRGAKNPVERASNISKDLKNLQVLKGIPIISVCQQNRNSTEDGVDTTHIAQSDRIAQDSTAIIFFENKDGILTLNLVKSRDSINGIKLKYQIDLNTGIFTYIPIDNDDDLPGAEDINEQINNQYSNPYQEDEPW